MSVKNMVLYWEDKFSPSHNGVGLESLNKYKLDLLCAADSMFEVDDCIILRWFERN